MQLPRTSHLFSAKQRLGQLGFTFIELLVTVAVLVTITGAGIAAFIRFNEKQVLIDTGKQLQTLLRSAQIKAAAHEVPSGCTTKLWAYRVNIPVVTPSTINMYARCGNDKGSQSNVSPPRDNMKFPAGISLSGSGSYDIDFYVHHGGVGVRENGSPVDPPVADITLTNPNGSTFEFSVTQGGEITEGVYTE